MVKKILKYVVMVTICVILLMLTLAFKPHMEEKNNDNGKQNKTVEEQVTEVMSITEEDKNVIGYLSIEKIGLEKAPIADGTENKIINNYVGHFKETAYFDGNVCLCSHNRGSKAAYFGELKNLSNGDEITYITKYETKKYEVQEIKKIEETDFSVLEQTEENKITLITCVENQKNLRLCVIGVEKEV
ncbi:MAG: class D sortase [Clostridia bacterium]|nr:class D sortase [Clostridia bacterium]